MREHTERLSEGPAKLPKFGLVLGAVLGSFSLACASVPVLVPPLPPCPTPSWGMVDEIDDHCSVGGTPFARCPYLYNYLEDMERYCDEMNEIRK